MDITYEINEYNEQVKVTTFDDGRIVRELHAGPPVLVVSAPLSVTMRQARVALHRAGLLDDINQLVATMPGEAGTEARIEWEFGASVERYSPLVVGALGALGLSESQIDDLFLTADGI